MEGGGFHGLSRVGGLAVTSTSKDFSAMLKFAIIGIKSRKRNIWFRQNKDTLVWSELRASAVTRTYVRKLGYKLLALGNKRRRARVGFQITVVDLP